MRESQKSVRIWIERLALLALTVFALNHAGGTWASELVRPSEVGAGTLLLRTETAGLFRRAPTVESDVRIAVTGMIARARVTQRFTNPDSAWVEGVYVFPLPAGAAVDHLRMRIGERVIEGQIKERAEARRTYEKAKSEGRKASLVEQERPNLFTNSVANIGPGETVEVTIEYQETVRYDSGEFRLRFPTVVGPRYIPGVPLAAEQTVNIAGTGWAMDTGQVPDASRITPPVVPPGRGAVNPLKLTVELDAGVPLVRVESNYHAAATEQPAPGRAVVRLADGPVPSDRDFELVWAPEPASAPRAALFTETRDDASYALMMLMPPQVESASRLPREVIYVVDTSGSMAGDSIVQAKAALRRAVERLAPADSFNIIQFNHTTDRLFDAPRPADGAGRSAALRYVDGLKASGGTEMAPALRLALAGRETEGRVRQVIFLTDGAVGNESALFGLIEQRLGNTRLFTVGIGSAPNSHFMERAARFGRGTFTYIGRVDEVGEKMDGLFRKLESPVLTDLKVNWPGKYGAEVWPDRLPDLYAGEPVLLTARLAETGGQAVFEGTVAGRKWRVNLPLAGGREESGIHVLWARRKIAALMDTLRQGAEAGQVRKAVTEVALRHHLVSKYTSLVAVDVTPSRPQGEGVDKRPVPTNLPAGWQHEKVFGRMPQTATAAPLWLLGGLLSFLLGLFGLKRGRGQA